MSACMSGTRGSGVLSSTGDVLVRGVGGVCDMCMCLARGGVGGEGGEWMRELGLPILPTSHFVSTIQRIKSTDMCPTFRMDKTHYTGVYQQEPSSPVNSVVPPLSHKRIIFPHVCRSHPAVERPESVPHKLSSTSGR